MSRKLIAAATMAAALTAGGAAGFALGAPLVSGAQESTTTTTDDGTTTTEDGTTVPEDDGTAEDGTAEDRPDHEGRGPGDCGEDGEAGSGDAETEGTSAST